MREYLSSSRSRRLSDRTRSADYKKYSAENGHHRRRPAYQIFGNIAVYTPGSLDAWADAKLRAPKHSTSDDRAGAARPGCEAESPPPSLPGGVVIHVGKTRNPAGVAAGLGRNFLSIRNLPAITERTPPRKPVAPRGRNALAEAYLRALIKRERGDECARLLPVSRSPAVR